MLLCPLLVHHDLPHILGNLLSDFWVFLALAKHMLQASSDLFWVISRTPASLLCVFDSRHSQAFADPIASTRDLHVICPRMLNQCA